MLVGPASDADTLTLEFGADLLRGARGSWQIMSNKR